MQLRKANSNPVKPFYKDDILELTTVHTNNRIQKFVVVYKGVKKEFVPVGTKPLAIVTAWQQLEDWLEKQN